MQSCPWIRAALGVALGFAVTTATAQTGTAPDAAPVATSPAQPAAGICPAGGKFVADTFSPQPAFPQQTRAPRDPASGGYAVQTVTSDVVFGRSMAFMPDGRMLLAERSGRLRIGARDGTFGAPIAGIPTITEPSALIGLMDVILDPNFVKNRRIYLSYVTPKPGQPPPTRGIGKPPDGIGHIARARLAAAGDRLEALTVLFEGSRVRRVVAPGDGTLYFSTIAGDEKAQALEEDGGKVLRINIDGTAPADNPFASRKDVGRLAYDLGHRDADGMARDAQGRIWTVEHGPRGGDELNLIRPGRNYGFPIISYGREYSGAEINGGLTAKEGLEQPIYYWTPDVAPSGLMIYSGAMFPQWKGNIFAGALVAESLIRLAMKNDQVASEAFMLADRCERIRDVREAPDGSIFVLTDGAAGKVLRLTKN